MPGHPVLHLSSVFVEQPVHFTSAIRILFWHSFRMCDQLPHTLFRWHHPLSSSKALQMLQESGLPGPGSEYAHLISATPESGINPATGLCKTRNNPSSTYCTTPACAGCKQCDHDTKHCFGKGDGMAGQAPWQKVQHERKVKEPVAAAVLVCYNHNI